MFSKQKKEGRWTEPQDKEDYGHLPWGLRSRIKESEVRKGAFAAHGRRWGQVKETKKSEAKLTWLDDKSDFFSFGDSGNLFEALYDTRLSEFRVGFIAP